MAADIRVVRGSFLDQPSDFAIGEEFFKGEENVEIHPARDDQTTCRGKAILVQNLDGGGRHLEKVCRGKAPSHGPQVVTRIFPPVARIFSEKDAGFSSARRTVNAVRAAR
jgi:hypothetical protein